MSIGNPIFLWGLPAVAFPVLLHLFYRRRKTHVSFSTVQFFRQRQRYLAHRRRLRELLLLLLRTLALLFLVLALARPLFQHLPFAVAARTDVVIVLDDTLSMGRKTGSGKTAYDLARRKAADIIASLRSGDGAALVWMSGRNGAGITRRRQQVKQSIDGLSVTGAAGSYSAALQRASEYLAESTSPNREIYVISDFQKNQLPAEPAALAESGDVRCYFLRITGTEENVAVTSVELSSKPKVVGRIMQVPYELKNYGVRERGIDVQLDVDGEERENRHVVLGGGETVTGVFEMAPGDARTLIGSVQVRDTDLYLDNRRGFATEVVKEIRILLLESDVLTRAQPFFFLENALAPPDNPRINGMQGDTSFVQEISPATLRDYHVVVLANPDTVGDRPAGVLEDYVARGGTVVSFAGSKVSPLTFKAFDDPGIRNLYGNKHTVDTKGIRFDHDLAALNKLVQSELIQWRRLQAMTPPATGRMLAEVRGKPLAVAFAVGRGRWVGLACSARRDYSNWPELTSFPVAMIHLFDYAAHERPVHRSLECGRPLQVGGAGKPVTVRRLHSPEAASTLAGDARAYTETWLPGFLQVDGADIGSAVLVPSTVESDLEVVGANEAADRIVRGQASVLSPDADLRAQIETYRRGNDLSGVFVLLMLACLTVEAVIGNTYAVSGATGSVRREPVLSGAGGR